MKFKDLIYYALLIFAIVLCFYLISLLRNETSQCIRNPFIYGAKKMGNVECSCQQFKGSCPALFYFNEEIFNSTPNSCGTVSVYSGWDINKTQEALKNIKLEQ